MKIIVKKHDFMKALSRVRRLADEVVTVTISADESFIVISSEKDTMLGNPFLRIRSVFAAETPANGESIVFSLVARKLSEIVKNLDGENFEMEVSVNDNKAIIKGSKTRFDLIFNEVPVSPRQPEISNFRKVSSRVLTYLMEKSIYAIPGGKNYYDTRFYDSCIFLDRDRGEDAGYVRMVGTNGHILAMSEAREDSLVDLPSDGLLLPYEGVKALLDLIKDYGEEEVDFGFSESTVEVGFAGGETVITVGVIDRKYVEYRRVLEGANENNGNKILRFSSDILPALKRAFIIDRTMRFAATSSGNIQVFSEDDFGENMIEEISGIGAYESSDNDALAVNLNYGYIANAMKTAFGDSEQVEVLIKDGESPVLVRPVTVEEGYRHLALMMPIISNQTG